MEDLMGRSIIDSDLLYRNCPSSYSKKNDFLMGNPGACVHLELMEGFTPSIFFKDFLNQG